MINKFHNHQLFHPQMRRKAKDPFFDGWSAQEKSHLNMGSNFERCFPGQTFKDKLPSYLM